MARAFSSAFVPQDISERLIRQCFPAIAGCRRDEEANRKSENRKNLDVLHDSARLYYRFSADR